MAPKAALVRSLDVTATHTEDGWVIDMHDYPHVRVRVPSLDEVGRALGAVLRQRRWAWSDGSTVRIVSYR